jgi:flavodoxin I
MAKSTSALLLSVGCAVALFYGQGLVFVAPKPTQQMAPHRLASGSSTPETIGGSGAGLLLTLAAGSAAFASVVRKPRRTSMEAVGLFYATQTGNTETAATAIGEATGLEATDVSDYSAEDLAEYDGLIVGTPTWNTGADEYRSGVAWDDLIDEIKGLDLSGKTVAVFGTGDSAGYGDNFCDGIEEMYSTFKAAGATMVGSVDSGSYAHSESKSDQGGKFLGLPLDEDNESDQTGDRVSAWVSQIKGEGMPL